MKKKLVSNQSWFSHRNFQWIFYPKTIWFPHLKYQPLKNGFIYQIFYVEKFFFQQIHYFSVIEISKNDDVFNETKKTVNTNDKKASQKIFYKIKIKINNIHYFDFTQFFRKLKFETIHEQQKIHIFWKIINDGHFEKKENLHNKKTIRNKEYFYKIWSDRQVIKTQF